MERRNLIRAAMRLGLALSLLGVSARSGEEGLVLRTDEAQPGYTLFSPLHSTKTYLIDLDGRIVHTWESDCPPGNSVYLLENGHLLRTGALAPEDRFGFDAGGAGGRVQEFTWEGRLVWDFIFASEEGLLHHDIASLPNGHILMIAWERISRRDALAAGRHPGLVGSDGVWADQIIEVKPTGERSGEIVWRWRVWDHLVQDGDRAKPGYGSPAVRPERIDLNHGNWPAGLTTPHLNRLKALGYIDGRGGRETHPDWTHINSVAYNPSRDQIVVSVLGFNEIWVIDHSTTTEEAAGSTGGRAGKGGDLLYRWGNPGAYGLGTAGDQRLFAQHDAQWIRAGLEGGGHILVFNNGRQRPGGDFSSVDEIIPPLDGNGVYIREGDQPFGPDEAAWSYRSTPGADFFSINISGAQRLPNGNTLICSGEGGALFEVTPEGRMVWKYINPYRGRPSSPGTKAPPPGRSDHRKPPPERKPPLRKDPGRPGSPEGMNSVFKARRYAPDHPGLRELTRRTTKERAPAP